MDTKSIEKIKISGEAGEKAEISNFESSNFISNKIKEAWKRNSVKLNTVNDKAIKEELIKNKFINDVGHDVFNFKKFNKKFVGFEDKIGIIDLKNKTVQMYDKKTESEVSGHIFLEAAEDNSPLYDQRIEAVGQYAGNRLYIINGKIVSGWSLYYSPHCLTSPEDYQRNIDIIYNVPYIYAAYEITAQLGLGCDFIVTDKKVEESEMEKYCNWLLKKKLKMTTNFRKKLDFHLSSYGNSYTHISWDEDGLPRKLTTLQPERMKVYLDPMTSRVLFYVYLPPIIGGTMIMSYPSLSGMTSALAPSLSFPSPVIIPVNNIIHLKNGDYTEYPFGFSSIKSAIDVATARFDVNVLTPFYFKKYCKATYVAKYDGDIKNPGTIKLKLDKMKDKFDDLEPGSDIIHGPGWTISTINPATGQSEIFNLTTDLDQQMFSVVGVPETYFKPKGATDRMFSETDKIFNARQEQKRNMFGEIIVERLLKPGIDKKFKNKGKKLETATGFGPISSEDIDADPNFAPKEVVEDYADEFKYPVLEWLDLTKKDETQEIANTISLLDAAIISPDRAAKRVGEQLPSEDPVLQEFQQQIRQGTTEDQKKDDMQKLKDKGSVTDMPSRSEKVVSPLGDKKHAPNAKPKKPIAPPAPRPSFSDEFSDFDFEGESIKVKLEE